MRNSGRPVQLLHRSPAERAGGLGTAVSEGFAATDAAILLVLDADLQHPPEMARTLADVAAATGADLVLACRYCPGGVAAGLAGPIRRAVSAACRQLTRAVLRRVRHINDPLGGFFAVHRDVIADIELQPDGFKILLEILIKGHWDHAIEVPYTFGPRAGGKSKAHIVEGMRFLRHLSTLRRTTPSQPPTTVTTLRLDQLHADLLDARPVPA